MIHATLYVCPSRHLCVGVAWDDERTTLEATLEMCHSCMEGEARKAGVERYACGQCGSAEFTIYDVPTYCETKEGAIGEMFLHAMLGNRAQAEQ